MPSKISTLTPIKPGLLISLGLPKSASASEIYSVLAQAPAGTNAEFFYRGLSDPSPYGESLNGRRRNATRAPFAALTDADEIEAALEAALERGSEIANKVLRAAVVHYFEARCRAKREGVAPPAPPAWFGIALDSQLNIGLGLFEPMVSTDLILPEAQWGWVFEV
jgi:hypothetical protein